MYRAYSYAQKVLLSILLDSYSEKPTWPQSAFAALSCFLGWKCMNGAIFMAGAHMVGKGRLKSAVSFLRALHGTARGALALHLLLFCSFYLKFSASHSGQYHRGPR